MIILDHPKSRVELKAYAANTFGDMIKCVADVDKGILAIDADLHADLERLLLDHGSQQGSLINIRSWQGNPSRDVLDPKVREKIAKIVSKFITD